MNERLHKALCGEPLQNKWLSQALIFKESAMALNNTFHHTQMPVFMSFEVRVPAMILMSFSCELSLKGILKADKIQQTHSLKNYLAHLKAKRKMQ